MKHSLTNKDKAALTADCSVCGLNVAIVKNSKYGYACRAGRLEAKDRYKAAHPERVRESKKRPPSKHRLALREGGVDTCAICGPVEPVVMGRGWGCPNRAKELGRTKFADAPQPRCLACRTFLDRFGSCAKCDDDLSDLERTHIPSESRSAMRDFTISSRFYEDGFSILDPNDPLVASDEPSVVQGWKTLGSREPWTGVRPEYAACYSGA